MSKLKAICFEGPKVVGNAIAYGIANGIARTLSQRREPSYLEVISGGKPLLDRLQQEAETSIQVSFIAVGFAIRLKKSVGRFKSEWKKQSPETESLQ